MGATLAPFSNHFNDVKMEPLLQTPNINVIFNLLYKCIMFSIKLKLMLSEIWISILNEQKKYSLEINNVNNIIYTNSITVRYNVCYICLGWSRYLYHILSISFCTHFTVLQYYSILPKLFLVHVSKMRNIYAIT